MATTKNQLRVTRNVTTNYVTRFQREEMKFFVDNKIVDLLILEFANFMQPDSYSQKGPYAIHSVYFDTLDWQAFYTKMDGNERRQKFRIRSYVEKPESSETVFVEIKGKVGQTVFKRRTPVNYADAKRLAYGLSVDKSSPIIDEWRFGLLRNALKPKILNSYHRLAFHSENFPGLRITIDQNLRYTLTNQLSFDQPLRSGYWSMKKSVIEIKFDRYLPQFVINIIHRYNLKQSPISKYCDSVISHFLL